jgi:hypothetical protein
LLTAFLPRPRTRLKADPPRTMQVRTTDAPGEWHLEIGSDQVVVTRGAADADATVSGTAADMFLFLWNRAPLDAVSVAGDAALLDLWRSTMTIRWS